MTDKLIEHRIRKHYVAENGEWLVEKDKVKEAKLLKEACETIESLRHTIVRLEAVKNALKYMLEQIK